MNNCIIKRRSIPDHQLPEDLHPAIARIYAARNILTAEELDLSLQALPGPESLKGMDVAVELIANAITAQQKILVVGDFDADGATSCAVAVRGLRLLGAQKVDFLVPNRFEYGYGLTPEILELAKQYQPELIITVDNGIASIEGIAAANVTGIPVIVTDHHLPGQQLPNAAAIVNPNQPGCQFPSKALAGVGVMFYVLLGLRQHMRATGQLTEDRQPNMAQLLDLVALGTVADVVPLDRINRTLVAQGLSRMRAGHACAGIKALAGLVNRPVHRLVSTDLGFFMGPRLNAAGRLDDMTIGIRCLLTDSMNEANTIAAQLDQLNRERRIIQSNMEADADGIVETLVDNMDVLPKSLCLYEPHWHQGVVGLVASRLKERLHRPVIVFAPGDNGQIKGSARSIEGLHIRDALDAVATGHPVLLSKFGGHAMAAGMTINEGDLDAFRTAFETEVDRHLDYDDLKGVVLSDGELQQGELTLDFAELLASAGPWGQGMPEPVFEGEFEVMSERVVGETHLKLILAADTRVDAIGFGMAPDGCAPGWRRIRVVFRLGVNEFRNQLSAQLFLEHAEPI
jgi:single-stranded-DNA-specific exonuclease